MSVPDSNEEIFEYSTFSNIDQCKVTHAHFDWEVDFQHKVIRGHVDLRFELLRDGVDAVYLDTRDLNVYNVMRLAVDAKPESSPPAQARSRGSYMVRAAERKVAPEEKIDLKFKQTADKKHPYLFSQCQAIHARSLFPCQDSPSTKQTYSAFVHVPEPLTALMSASSRDEHKGKPCEKKSGYRTFCYFQPIPICSYLVAIAVGALESRPIGPRSAVWAEASIVEAAAYEFAETESFIKAAEAFLGPYQWTRYDVLCLPPSFPYGGMENPQLTFVTPTLIAGDRSLANVVAHEISHSWSGNATSNRTWQHFWLNEGFTVYIERRIAARVYGESHFDFSALIGWKALKESVDLFESRGQGELTALVPNLEGIDPDDAFSSVPYEKGFNFLYYLQGLVGGVEPFEHFLNQYFSHFQFKCIASDEFKEFFLAHFSDASASVQKALAGVDWDTWFTKPGMPIVTPNFDQTLATQAKELALRWREGGVHAAASDIEGWHAAQVMYFLDAVLDVEDSDLLSLDTLVRMDNLYGFTSSQNCEIRFRWFSLCVRAEHTLVFDSVADFLGEQGRMKYVRPLYRALYAKEAVGRPLALRTFAANRDSYHPVCAKMLARDLGLSGDDAKARIEKASSIVADPETLLGARWKSAVDRIEAAHQREKVLRQRREALAQRDRAVRSRLVAVEERELATQSNEKQIESARNEEQKERREKRVSAQKHTAKKRDKKQRQKRSQFIEKLYGPFIGDEKEQQQ